MIVYKCSLCGGEFESDTSDEEVLEEAKELFPEHSYDKMEIVCDDCWKKVMV